MFLIFAQLLSVPTPCFDVDVAIPLDNVLEIRLIHDGVLVSTIDRGGLANEIRASACGEGDWIVESRTGSECVEIDELGQRRATGQPCVWRDWIETMTATVTKNASPFPPTFQVKLDSVHEDDDE